jgi:two-component system response regulator PilR (NtrC family)
MQVKLLRVIQEKTVRPVGATEEIPVDVRILSATHKDLRSLVNAGQFREDLYYRVNVIELRVPTLKERGQDIELLTGEILQRLAKDMAISVPELDDSARAKLAAYHFPGNVRELENILERAVALAGKGQVSADDIHLQENTVVSDAADHEQLGAQLESVERDAIEEALKANRYNKTATAKQLGLTLRALRYRIQKLGLD